jgi:ABC-2 type transport system permease protein
MKSFTATGKLLRLYLRRDRVLLPSWVGLLVLLTVGTSAQYARLFTTDAERLDFTTQVTGNAALNAFTGQLYGHDLGNLTVWKIGDIVYSLIAVLVVLNVMRHTRGEEESGRQELVRAGVVGRHASLAAALILALGASLLTGALITGGLIGAGLDATGSVAFGAAVAMPGCVFAVIAAVAAQLTERARTGNVIAATVLGVAYLLRFVADGSGVLWLRWLSPTGWSHLLRPYGNENWLTLLLPLTVTIAAGWLAFVLSSRRDLGAGAIPSRPGPETAGTRLGSALALAWRLQRGQLLGWTFSFAVVATATAAVANGIPSIADQAGPQVQEFFNRYADGPGQSISDIFIWLILITLGYMAALYPMLATLQLRTEEATGRAEMTLSAAVKRTHWAAGHLLFAALGTALMMAVSGVAAGLVYGLARGDVGTELPRVLLAAVEMVPAAWAVGALAILAYGLVPRFATAICWVGWLLVNIFGESLGPILGIQYGVANTVIPFHYLPKVLSGAVFSATPMIGLTGVAIVIGGLGLAALRRRDLSS